MARNARKLVGAQGEVVGRTGKLRHVTLSVSGDRVYNLREVNVSGNVIYKLDTALVNSIHQDLDLGFRTALFAEVVSGTTGELNVLYE
tara:strand:+ start:79 stop:342 length:264 start_codon:yes stop_codon:yes gene_type:complete